MTARLTFLLLAFLLVLAPHAGADVPIFGKRVTTSAPKGVLTYSKHLTVTASVDISNDPFDGEIGEVRLRIPNDGNGQVERTWVLYGKDKHLNNGKAFPLAQLQTTADFNLLNEKGYDRIWSYDFDRYFNTCLKKDYEVSASGGSLYCDVHYPRRVEYRQTTRVTKQYPRPRVISITKTWPNPVCEVGATSIDTSSSPVEDIVRVCQDGASDYNRTWGEDGFVNGVPGCGSTYSYPRTTTVVARIPQVRGRPRTRTTILTDCDQDEVKGPGWVESSRSPLPAPTVTVASIEGPTSGGFYTVRGTLVSNYRKGCWIDIYVVTADGASQGFGYVWPATPGETHTWGGSSTFNGQTPTSTASGIAKAYC